MSIQYYNTHADSFFENTINVDMEELYRPFIQSLAQNALILDAGCGSGRDSKAFLNRKFRVEAIDASIEMVKKAQRVTGLEVKHLQFKQIDTFEHYDAIWTCASLLHVPENELPSTMKVLSKALKPNGIWYLSFKYGTEQRKKDGRSFTDMNESKLQSLVCSIDNLEITTTWITTDKRPDRNERWLNAMLKKL